MSRPRRLWGKAGPWWLAAMAGLAVVLSLVWGWWIGQHQRNEAAAAHVAVVVARSVGLARQHDSLVALSAAQADSLAQLTRQRQALGQVARRAVAQADTARAAADSLRDLAHQATTDSARVHLLGAAFEARTAEAQSLGLTVRSLAADTAALGALLRLTMIDRDRWRLQADSALQDGLRLRTALQQVAAGCRVRVLLASVRCPSRGTMFLVGVGATLGSLLVLRGR